MVCDFFLWSKKFWPRWKMNQRKFLQLVTDDFVSKISLNGFEFCKNLWMQQDATPHQKAKKWHDIVVWFFFWYFFTKQNFIAGLHQQANQSSLRIIGSRLKLYNVLMNNCKAYEWFIIAWINYINIHIITHWMWLWMFISCQLLRISLLLTRIRNKLTWNFKKRGFFCVGWHKCSFYCA